MFDLFWFSQKLTFQISDFCFNEYIGFEKLPSCKIMTLGLVKFLVFFTVFWMVLNFLKNLPPKIEVVGIMTIFNYSQFFLQKTHRPRKINFSTFVRFFYEKTPSHFWDLEYNQQNGLWGAPLHTRQRPNFEHEIGKVKILIFLINFWNFWLFRQLPCQILFLAFGFNRNNSLSKSFLLKPLQHPIF